MRSPCLSFGRYCSPPPRPRRMQKESMSLSSAFAFSLEVNSRSSRTRAFEQAILTLVSGVSWSLRSLQSM